MHNLAVVLVIEHIPFVKRIAYHLLAQLPPSILVEDLIQAGMVGLLETSKTYQPDRGASFASYSGNRIYDAMLDKLSIRQDECEKILLDISNTRVKYFEDLGIGEHADPSSGLSEDQGKQSIKVNLAEAIAELPDREKLIITSYFDSGLNLREVGGLLSIAESRVSEILIKAVMLLWDKLKN